MVLMSCTVNFSLIRMVSQSLLSPLGPQKTGRRAGEGGSERGDGGGSNCLFYCWVMSCGYGLEGCGPESSGIFGILLT